MSEVRHYLGRNIRKARERLGLRQEDLAGAIGAKRSETISQIERGRREVKAWELAKLADILKVDLLELLDPGGPEFGPAPLWRNQAIDSRQEAEAKLRLRSRRYRLVMELTDLCPKVELPRVKGFCFRDGTREDAERLAEDMRLEMELGDRPAEHLFDVLEGRYGVMIFYEDFGQDGSAVCVRGASGPAMLLNKWEAPWRRNFSCAHDLFHLLTWDCIPRAELREDRGLAQRIEKLADHFAGALLLPRATLQKALTERVHDGALTVGEIIQVAREFGVSTHALLVRMAILRMISSTAPDDILADPDFRENDRATMSGYWFTPPDLPKRFVELAFTAYKQGRISKARFAEFLETDLVELPRRLEEYGLDMSINASYETAIAHS